MATNLRSAGGSKTIDDPRQSEEKQIWEDTEEWIEPRSHGNKLHFREECVDVSDKNNRVDTACYPRGFRDLCKKCVYLWRQNRDNGE